MTYATTALLTFAALAGRAPGRWRSRDISLEGMGALRALALVLGLLSLAGIPPTPGFWAKLAVLDASWAAIGFWPTLIAALGGVFGALYYLKPLPDLLAVVRTAGATPLPSARGAGRGAGRARWWCSRRLRPAWSTCWPASRPGSCTHLTCPGSDPRLCRSGYSDDGAG